MCIINSEGGKTEMKRVCLLLAFVLFCCSLTGCDDPEREDFKQLDEDKAAEVALSYMNEKYDETFYVVKSEKDAAHGYVPGSIQDAWVDVTVAIAGDEAAKKYTVRLSLNEDRENYDIDWDNYMVTFVEPFFNKELNQVMKGMGLFDYIIYAECIHQRETKYSSCFFPSFEIPNEDATIEEVASKYCFNFGISIKISRNEANRLFGKESNDDVFDVFGEKFLSIFEDDFFRLYLEIYNDKDFSKMKKYKENSGTIPDLYISQYSRGEYFNS